MEINSLLELNVLNDILIHGILEVVVQESNVITEFIDELIVRAVSQTQTS